MIKIFLASILISCCCKISAQSKMVEIRSYNLKPGSRNEFNRLFIEEAAPLLKKWKIEVVAFGPSLHDTDSYFLMRSFKDLRDRQQSEDAFYGSDDWEKGPQDAILSLIKSYTTIVLPLDSVNSFLPKIKTITTASEKDERGQLSALNAQFIKNFLAQDAVKHGEIIHKDFVCIESDGTIINRQLYLQRWATDFKNSGYTSFDYTDELVRIFGDMALVKAKTVYTKTVKGKEVKGYTIYTDTYIKEDGKWQCIQVQITPVKMVH